MEQLTPAQVLDVVIDEPDSGARTVRDYLVALLAKLWEEDEMFSGKHPFGNSGWQYDVYTCLARAGVIEGTFDSDGYPEEIDERRGDALIRAAIKALAG